MRNQGFTMLEILVGLVILSMMGVLTYGATYGTIRTQKSVEELTAIQDSGTVLINKLREDFEQTYFVEAARKVTRFKGEDFGTKDRVSFTSLAHFRSSPTAHESDQVQITYAVEDNPAKPGFLLLKRGEEAIIAPKPVSDNVDMSSFVTIAENLTSFNVEYAADTEFKPTWDTTKEENLNKLPKLVRVTLSVKDDKDRERIFQTTTDIPMSESLDIAVAAPSSNPSASPSGGARTPPISSGRGTGP